MSRYTQAELEAAIAAIDAKLQTGVRTVSVDGTTTTVDLEHLRRERDRLDRQLQENRMRRPVSARINLGGF